MTKSATTDKRAARTAKIASVAYHVFVLLGEIDCIWTAFGPVTRWTPYAALLLMLAGLLTLVYPHVGADPHYARWVWGRLRRSAVPWLLLLLQLGIVLVHLRP